MHGVERLNLRLNLPKSGILMAVKSLNHCLKVLTMCRIGIVNHDESVHALI